MTETIQTDRPVEKAGKKMSGKNKETLLGIYESLGTFIKEFDDPEPEKNEPTKKKERGNRGTGGNRKGGKASD